ncbi:MAG: polysaccharide deacetylase family protein [Pyrinomonadaceae bacterium]
MKFVKLTVIFALLFVAANAQQTNRSIAITIDDLPVVSTRRDLKNHHEITLKLLAHLTKARVPAIGFVNENKLYNGENLDEKRVDLLRMWLDAGFDLGNHTFSHRSLNAIELTDYEADLLRGELVTKRLLASKKKTIKFFRHPFLQTGRSLQVKSDFDAFLKDHGFTIAPITFDNADYIFSRAYDIAFDRKDSKLLKRVGGAYIPYMEKKLTYWERQSVRLLGREMSQTLLIHANFINSDYLDDLIAMFKRRGYRCVDLETALNDEAYRLPDNFVGGAGISWLHRWALDRGRENVLPDEPMVPDFVLKLSGFESE